MSCRRATRGWRLCMQQPCAAESRWDPIVETGFPGLEEAASMATASKRWRVHAALRWEDSIFMPTPLSSHSIGIGSKGCCVVACVLRWRRNEPTVAIVADPLSRIQGASAAKVDSETEAPATAAQRSPNGNYAWAILMMRVFALDVLECECCGGRLRILASIHSPENTRKILDCLGLPSRTPPLSPAVYEARPDDI